MKNLTEEIVRHSLKDVIDNYTNKDVVSSGIVSTIQFPEKGHVLITLEVEPSQGPSMEPTRQNVEKKISQLKGVKKVTAILTAKKEQEPANDPHGMNKNPPLRMPVKKIIAVASGKGGVGKSTVAFNLAMAMKEAGKKAGLLDADIYGPSVPKLSGIEGQKPEQREGKIKPLEINGLKVMSIGFLTDQDTPMIWRGPMVQTALYQMLRDVSWGTEDDPLDVLVIDMPPGTGDAQLTLAQKVPVTGALIVSTPQDLALIDARKAIEMFRKTKVPILGIIENMSTHICSNCGHEEHIFGHGGAKDTAAKLGVPFLGEIPLDVKIRESADQGVKSSVAYFTDIAIKLT